MLTFDLAILEQTSIVKNLLLEVQKWLYARGLSQWNNAFSDYWIQTEILNQHFYIVTQGTTIVATFRLLTSDPAFWGEDDASALYLHTLAVARTAQGQSIGTQILDWVTAKAQSDNKSLFRLDCLANNPFLVNYYAKYGFQCVRKKWVQESEYVLYEKKLT
ncbi:GNAT family N-acetyltransferase [Cytophagaceae bacterium DM2B3-1]|uniref:GNAT family N-acetyltransferase n=1 Tax=Xanthocytophaga flava TaxID=3048013 RepID=A0ABT7CF38_9BACT|nr:GNAT family N-acetyltransferase [Xanthocytophaga flavus]MDJ1472961.1 GNAT family N-acetyltransferase [Xanthocytophaga flavus]MDJ1492360.1 GNAT family N-acetyltransferase [Xanthocytophaga flavus]